jgi:hypothetical protein
VDSRRRFIDFDHRDEIARLVDHGIRPNQLDRAPADLDRLSAGSTPVFGVAFAGLRRITDVEVRIDDGDWTHADLLQDASSLVWTQWSFDWAAADGRHKIAVRATDDTDFVQTTEGQSILSSAFPAGTDNIHAVVVTVG